MAKKIIHLTEKELVNLIKESISRIGDIWGDLPSADNNFDLNQIPMEVLDRGYTAYAPYWNVGMTYGNPLRPGLNESADFTWMPVEVQGIITRTYPIDEMQFKIVEGYNNMSACILCSYIDNNGEIIEKSMKKLGYFRSQPTNEQLLLDPKGRVWQDMRFEPLHPEHYQMKIQSNRRYVYHLAPEIFADRIRKEGLNPSNNNAMYQYSEDRVYVFTKPDLEDVQNLANELYTQAMARGYQDLSPNYVLFKIDRVKLPKGYKFFGDINTEYGVYLTEPVPATAIVSETPIVADAQTTQ